MPGPSLVVSRSTPAGRLGGLLLAGRAAGSRGAPPGRPVRFPSYGCTYLTSGAGRYVDEGNDVELGPGSFVTVRPGHPHWYGAVGGGTWDELFLVFDGPVVRFAAQVGLLDPALPVRRLLPISYWARRLDRFRLRPAPQTAVERDQEAAELLVLFTEIAAASVVAAPSAGDDWYERSCRLLDDDLSRTLTLHEVAADVGMRYETWRKAFRRRSGVSPDRYRLQRRVDAALAMLDTTTLSTREIAATLGFTDEHHLVRHVRATTGRSPRAHRERHRVGPNTMGA